MSKKWNKSSRTHAQEVPYALEIQPRQESIKPFIPRTTTQKLYANAMLNYKIVVGLGPPGTGKSYVALAVAADRLKAGEIDRIIITRPIVEAGESLGFLPGEEQEKVAPYMRPMLEILNERLGKSFAGYLIKTGQIAFEPLAYLRGRTFNDAVVVLDEAQNTSKSQMKMFLSRMGRNCTMVVDGDIDQQDTSGLSGLQDMANRLKHISSICFVKFEIGDIVRDPLVKEIILAYRN